ncbi:MAG: tRNA (guanine-N7-)-methyltransferase [Lysobacterales bacterium]
MLRKGRLTEAQARALEVLWPKFGIDASTGKFDPSISFGRTAPLIIEIGFGNGDATWQMARDEPDKNFIGIEVHKPGVGHLLQALESQQLNNVRIVRNDAVDFIRDKIPNHCVSGVRVYFPDPWHKKRHHKRRLIQPGFLDLLAEKMAAGGLLHLATDWQPYAEHMLEVCNEHPAFENLSPTGGYCEKPAWRPETKFERRGTKLGHESFDLLFTA